ncbi:hypothetical protein, partial [Bacillus altitudinis]|uniref:hypothetical protein n=1 Tax=Bacillus altitudinis TaxID=293387 RepID=UPI001C92BD0A
KPFRLRMKSRNQTPTFNPISTTQTSPLKLLYKQTPNYHNINIPLKTHTITNTSNHFTPHHTLPIKKTHTFTF